MAGNKKPRKKLGKMGAIGSTVRAARSRADKRQFNITMRNAVIRADNMTPLGDPANAHKVDLTFAPLERALAQIELSGEIECDEIGRAIIHDPVDGSIMNLAEAFSSSVHIFALVEPTLQGFEPMPGGMLRVAEKMEAGLLLYQSDIDGARATIAWMRRAIAGITPNEWSEICDRALMEAGFPALKVA